jgi:hypothetical protein
LKIELCSTPHWRRRKQQLRDSHAHCAGQELSHSCLNSSLKTWQNRPCQGRQPPNAVAKPTSTEPARPAYTRLPTRRGTPSKLLAKNLESDTKKALAKTWGVQAMCRGGVARRSALGTALRLPLGLPWDCPGTARGPGPLLLANQLVVFL